MVVFEVRKKLTSAAVLGAVLSMSTGLALGQEIKPISGGMGAAATHDTKAAVKFTEIVKEKTDGRIEITHYSGGQLGKGQKQMEAVSIGTQHFLHLIGIPSVTSCQSFRRNGLGISVQGF